MAELDRPQRSGVEMGRLTVTPAEFVVWLLESLQRQQLPFFVSDPGALDHAASLCGGTAGGPQRGVSTVGPPADASDPPDR